MTNLAISYDGEYLPVGISSAQYERRSHMIGLKADPYIDELFGVKYHLDGIGCEAAPLQPFKSVDHLLMSEQNNRLRLSDLMNCRLVGVNCSDLNDWELHEVATPRLYESVHEFGCSPDYKRGRRRQVPDIVRKSTVRELGMHFHFNMPEKYWNNHVMCAGPVAEIEQATRVQFLSHIADNPDGFRPWYRVQGVYRPTAYGIEYRSFGASIVHDEAMFRFVATVMWEVMVEAFKSDARSIHV